MLIFEKKEKLLCKKKYYSNLNKPYFWFNEGEYYWFEVRKHEEGITIYESIDCGYMVAEENFKKNFYTIEELREEKINKILK
jgi:hypothetical protein